MIRRASLKELHIGLTLVVNPTRISVKESLVGKVMVVKDIKYRDNEIWTIEYRILESGEDIRSSIDLFSASFIVYNDLTEKEKFLMKLKGELIE